MVINHLRSPILETGGRGSDEAGGDGRDGRQKKEGGRDRRRAMDCIWLRVLERAGDGREPGVKGVNHELGRSFLDFFLVLAGAGAGVAVPVPCPAPSVGVEREVQLGGGILALLMTGADAWPRPITASAPTNWYLSLVCLSVLVLASTARLLPA